MTTNSYQPGPLRHAEVTRSGDRWALVFTRDFPQPPAAVWAALTDPDELRQWAPYTADRPLTATGPVTLIAIDDGEEREMPGEITAADPPALLEFTWDTDVLRWELTAAGDGTRLRLTHRLTDRATSPMVAAGWHVCLDVVELLLAGTPVGPITGPAALEHGWAELSARYAEQLGFEPPDAPR
ncbi:SRPBCC family protein [Nocardia asteroides]|uniref:SRPBCC family protein n=1 Tax=Nocardia asteroides TaxID=1824 RepID=UPI001E5D0C06|nr:SRPBCC family protein [Nocardia asteroides]UGT61669.1 SRPBCC family protein [Nocardia asteroides]